MLIVFGHKSLTHLPTSWRSNGNVLQIGMVATQAPCGSNRLIVHRMDTLGFFVYVIWQSSYVSVVEFLHAAPFQNIRDYGMIFGKCRQHFFSRGILSRFGFFRLVNQFKLIEQNRPQLLGRCQIKGLTGLFKNTLR